MSGKDESTEEYQPASPGEYQPDSPGDSNNDEPEDGDPEEPEQEQEDEDEEDEDISSFFSENEVGLKTVNENRKAFVKWLNQDFYKRIQGMSEESPLKVYQVLVQNYLGLSTPYRGLLVYHGLGTGKTASAISLSEGLSKELRITTLLPASLETEFTKEVRKWGQDELNREGKWIHRPLSSFSKQELRELSEKYALNGVSITKITNSTKKQLKKEIAIQKDKDSFDEGAIPVLQSMGIREMTDRISQLKGCFLPDPDGVPYEKLDYFEKAYLDQQILWLIQRKYNFIHYRPFPKVIDRSVSDYVKGDDPDEDEELLRGDEGDTKKDTENQKIAKLLERRLRYNQKHHSVNSPFFREVLVVDEVHNLVRQILNGSKTSRIFYEWIVNAQEVKLVFLSGTPIINRASEIAILYNMLKGLIRVYSFTLETEKSAEELTEVLTRIFYKDLSPIDLFYIESKGGKIIISFTMSDPKFESALDKDGVVYTVKEKDHTFQDFLSAIYDGLHKVVKPDKIVPKQSVIENMSKKKMLALFRGDPQIFDKDLEVVFNRSQKLFDIEVDGQLKDMTDNERFMNYFFESVHSRTMNAQRRTLLKRMLMGMTSYYPIDRSSIVDMPQIVKPVIVPEAYKDVPIVKDMNIVPCMMSQVQFEKYAEAWEREKSMDRGRVMRQDGDDAYHYHTRTRQACNIVFRKDDFRTMKIKTKEDAKEADDLKQQTYSQLLETKDLSYDNDLKYVSPKMYQILKNMKKFTPEGRSTGKVLFYSDFRSDAGSEAFEVVLKSNGYERFDADNPPKETGLRYTFITGSEPTEERRRNKEYYNADKNKYGEYVQIMIISSAGAEGISLTCVRQVHILEPYWNYVRIDQVLGRAIRMRSHNALDKKDRNVEQYMYLSILPYGSTMEEIFETVKNNKEWTTSTGIPVDSWTDVKAELAKEIYKSVRDLFETIIRINMDTSGTSVDQELFQVMDQKYQVSQEIVSAIQESSIDCIQHTRDNPQLNDRCVRFTERARLLDTPFQYTNVVQTELAYFPGINAQQLEILDKTQLVSEDLHYQKPDIYVVTLLNPTDMKETDPKVTLVYYQYDNSNLSDKSKPDIRYLRERGTRLCDLILGHDGKWIALKYADKHTTLDEILGKQFSVTHEVYDCDSLVEDETPPPFKQMTAERRLIGYRLKENVKEIPFYMTVEASHSRAIHRFVSYKQWFLNGFQMPNTKYILYNQDVYVENSE